LNFIPDHDPFPRREDSGLDWSLVSAIKIIKIEVMVDTIQSRYAPDYLVTPGEVLEEYLESCGMTQAELAAKTGLAKKTINEIIKGKSPITTETALKLERCLGRPANFWNNLKRQFQEDRTCLAENERLQSRLDWLQPVSAMIKLEWRSFFL
jgi:HTH-type transcriptional regulator / antitoxin HigA